VVLDLDALVVGGVVGGVGGGVLVGVGEFLGGDTVINTTVLMAPTEHMANMDPNMVMTPMLYMKLQLQRLPQEFSFKFNLQPVPMPASPSKRCRC
jgi:hypothetical protein